MPHRHGEGTAEAWERWFVSQVQFKHQQLEKTFFLKKLFLSEQIWGLSDIEPINMDF